MLQWNLENLNKGRIPLFWELNLPKETDPATNRKTIEKIATNRKTIKEQTNCSRGIRSTLENN